MKAVDLLQQQSDAQAEPDSLAGKNGSHQYSNPQAIIIDYISTDEEELDLDETDGAVINGKAILRSDGKNLPRHRDSYSKLNGNAFKTEIKPESNGDSTILTNGGFNEKYNDVRTVENGVPRGTPSGDSSNVKLPNGVVPKGLDQSAALFQISNTEKTVGKRPESLAFSLPERSESNSKSHIIQNGAPRFEENPPLANAIKRSEVLPPLVNGVTRHEGIQPLIISSKRSDDVPPATNGVQKSEEIQPMVNGVKTTEEVQPLVNGIKRSEEIQSLVNGMSIKRDDLVLSFPERHQRLPNGTSAEDMHHNLMNELDKIPPSESWDRAVAEVKEQAFARLQEELRKAHQELRLRDEEVTRLSRIREEVEAELEELTASLFQEAHNMVREANVRQASAERSFKESQMQVEVLTAEVSALKTLVLTSTPSRPNPHLHPQIDPRGGRTKDDGAIAGVSLFNRKHRRSPSHFNLKYGRENSPPESPVKEQRTAVPDPFESKDGWEVDPNIHKEFVAWKQNPKVEKADPFIARVYSEDINLCLDFTNQELGAKVQEAVEEGNVFIEAVSDKAKTIFPKKCALLEAPRQCHYRMKLGDQEQWHCISQICRNRIIAVCDFLNYLRYIERGLVKSSVHDVYWEITRLRKEMVLARLGLALSS